MWWHRALSLALLYSIGFSQVGANDLTEGPLVESYDMNDVNTTWKHLSSEQVVFPVNMGDLSVKLGSDRQLFLDNYLIADSTGVMRQVQRPVRYEGNPIRFAKVTDGLSNTFLFGEKHITPEELGKMGFGKISGGSGGFGLPGGGGGGGLLPLHGDISVFNGDGPWPVCRGGGPGLAIARSPNEPAAPVSGFLSLDSRPFKLLGRVSCPLCADFSF